MKILVTGAAGFIGSHLSERLIDLGHTVIGLDCFTPYYYKGLKELNSKDIQKKGVELLTLDLVTDNLTSAIQDVDIIYHLAAQPGISQKTSFDEYLRNNVVATFKLMEAVKNSSTLQLFVNIATSSIYGKHATDAEDAAPKPISYYGVTKLAAEQLALTYCRDKKVPVCSTRLFSVYGPRERPEKVYPKFIRSIFDENYYFTYREGSDKHLRSYTYVGDIIDGFVAILENKEKCIGEIFNLGIDTAVTTGEALNTLERVSGAKAKVKMVPPVPGDQEVTKANIDKAKRMLNYNPQTNVETGFKKFVEWYKEKIANKPEFNRELY